MRRALILLLILSLTTLPARAQTDTPTPVPVLPIPTFDVIASPTPIPTDESATVEPSSGLPVNQVYNYLATAYVNLNSAPSDITRPGGQPLLPDIQPATVFGIAKWFFSSSTADALLGPFAPLLLHFVAYFSAVLILSNISVIIFVIRFLIRWVVWIYTQITKLIP